jgi:16S rRNA G1207 methylase RsmC
MKQLLALVVLALASTVFAAGEKKEICTDVKDKAGKIVKNKDGSDKQSCKTIKVHKKVEGDKVPDANKKK